MPWHSDVAYLREKAEQFRKLATRYETPLAAKMLELAADLEAKAAEIEARNR